MITIESLKSYQDTPPLRLLCIEKIIRNSTSLSALSKGGHVIPPEVGDLLAMAFRDYAIAHKLTERDCHKFYKHFKREHIPMSRIDFSGLQISSRFFKKFLAEYQDQLNEINISKCNDLTREDLRELTILKRNSGIHKTFIIGDTALTRILVLNSRTKLGRIIDEDLRVKKLVLHKIRPNTDADEFTINRELSEFLTPTMSNTLRYLDLSSSVIGKGSALMQLESLEILILYNCEMTYPNVILVIGRLKNLRVLDLSRQVVENDDYSLSMPGGEDPISLDLIVDKLSQLTRLDISGTSLVGGKDRNISAFESRSDRPFEFLGLFHTGHDAAYRSCIPALTIAGDATETQILNACEAYIDRPHQLSKALNDLYNLYKTITPSETFENVARALDVVLPILSRHMSDEQVTIFTTAALWCIVKINVTTKNLNDAKVRRTITSRLLDVMHYHQTNRVILINGGLTLLFLPDIICEHSRVAEISLLMCRDNDARTQGFGTTLLNTLACQVGGDQKVFIGQKRAIETMLAIIQAKIEDETCDEILETAWSTLWNITDETPVNCSRFLECNGLRAFEDCMDKFGNNKEVLRNIMGLLGNVAECKELRINFMQAQYIKRFESLLSSPIDGIECSYNACGILAHLISDGPAFWDHRSPIESAIDRIILADKMCRAISRWPINSKRNINYRSFEPIIRLIDANVSPCSQYWATFALANLTRINPAKYCPMLLQFNGLDKLRHLSRPMETEPCVSNLASITIYQYELYESERSLNGLEQCDSIDLEVVRNFRAEPNQGDGTSETGEIML